MTVKIADFEGPLAPGKLEAVEKQLRVRFPEDYRAFMMQYNGGRTDPDGFAISWREDQVAGEDWRSSCLAWLFFILDDPDDGENLAKMNQKTFFGRIPQGTIAVARDAGGI